VVEHRLSVVGLLARPCGLVLFQWLTEQPRLAVRAVFTHSRLPSSEDPNRGLRPEFPEYWHLARRHDVPLFAVDRRDEADFSLILDGLPPYDVLVSLSWRYWVPPAVLGRARLADINLHRGRLPEYGGAEPVRRMLEAGLDRAVITAHIMTAEIDRGEILAEVEHPMAVLEGETPDQAAERVKRDLEPLYPAAALRALNRLFSARGWPLWDEPGDG
jgi:methionyl-tRNA formyltransferase